MQAPRRTPTPSEPVAPVTAPLLTLVTAASLVLAVAFAYVFLKYGGDCEGEE